MSLSSKSGPRGRSAPTSTSMMRNHSGNRGNADSDSAVALREKLHLEIERKFKACSNATYECSLPRLESYNYCQRHILQDSRAPFKQCAHFYLTNERRCQEPAPKYDNKKEYGTNYCFEHSRLKQLSKTRSTIGKLNPVETTETLLHGLAHHVRIDKTKQHYHGNNTPLKITVHEDDDESDVDVVTPSVDPFVDIDVNAINDAGRVVLDHASDSDTDDEQQPTVGNSWSCHDMDNSDTESVDSQCEDLLKHAGIYTAEEATRITKDKLQRLRVLYAEQFQRLKHMLREMRREYLHDLRLERDIYCNIHDQVKDSPRERKLYHLLKAYNHYHRKHGVESLLHLKYIEKLAKTTEGLHQKPYTKCSYTEGGVKCGEPVLPLCKHCRKHILEEKKQVLFRACGVERSNVVCQEHVVNLHDDSTCMLHVELPMQKVFSKRQYESESEGEEDGLPRIGESIRMAAAAAAAAAPSSFAGKRKESPPSSELVNKRVKVTGQHERELFAAENNITIIHGHDSMVQLANIEEELPVSVISKSMQSSGKGHVTETTGYEVAMEQDEIDGNKQWEQTDTVTSTVAIPATKVDDVPEKMPKRQTKRLQQPPPEADATNQDTKGGEE